MDAITGLSFSRPEALLLLFLLIPLTVYLSRTSMALLRRGRRRFSLGLRIILITLLVLSLSGVGVVQASDRLSVVFLLDRSDSVSQTAQALQEAYLREAMEGMKPGDGAGVVAFGAEALVDRPVLEDKTPPDLTSAPSATYSNLDAAIRLGLAIAPADTARRLVLLSDGRENVGSAEWSARLAAAHGVSIDVVPLQSQSGPEVWVTDLKAPSPARENERVSLEISVASSTDTTATLVLLADGVPTPGQNVTLVRGTNTFVQTLPPAGKGFHTYGVQVVPRSGSDTRKENNRYSAFSLVLGKPRLLFVEGHESEAAPLVAALSPSLDAEVVGAAQMPADVRGLAGYDGVVLVNAPASAMSRRSLESLQIAVRDLGKGLIVVGGSESYAAGGYFRTPLEDMLPVDLNLPSKLDIPSVGMALVIDRSGSMEMAHSNSGGVKKIELAKEAAYRAVAQLSERDYVGVITFDDAANWVIEMQPLGDPVQLRGRIGSISSGGGTNIYAGLSPAVDALIESKAKSKHIVLLSDGVSAPGDYDGLTAKMAEHGITLSTVAVGSDSDLSTMQMLAQKGKGRYYYTEDGNALPEIFAQESHFAARSYLIEHPFTPERTSPSPILDGLGGMPTLQGYVGTSPKPGGQIALVSDAGDPVLAQWQYGLGRVVAWTSDAKGQWAREWVGWSEFPRFWGQAVRWTTGAEAAQGLQPRIEVQAGMARVTVDATSSDGAFLNNLIMGAVVVAPDLMTETVKLEQSAAGRYEGSFPANQEGAYLMQVRASGGNAPAGGQTLGLVVPYSPEYRGGDVDDGLLERIASLTRGQVLIPEQAQAAFRHTASPVHGTTELWPLLLLLAILLLPFDIGVRRVAVTRADLSRTWDEVRRRIGWQPRPVSALPGASTPQMAAMFSAKSRSQVVDTHETRVDRQSAEPASPAWARDLQLSGRTNRTPAGASPPLQPQLGAPDPAEVEESLATRLRKAREQRT